MSRLHALVAFALISASLCAAQQMPAPAIPGLRYYDPPEKVERRVIETDVCVYGGTSGAGPACAFHTRFQAPGLIANTLYEPAKAFTS